MASVDTKDMWHAKHDRIRETAKRQIEGGIDAKRGFILGTSCETPVGTPATAVYTLVKAAKDFGTFK
jgi:uroporphyrinogen decarboxylase